VVVNTGLQLGKAYAWRVRGIAGAPLEWGSTHRFETQSLPEELPPWTVTLGGGGSGLPEPGVTLFNLRSPAGLFAGEYALAVDSTGEVVWFVKETGGIGDLRLLPNGHVLYISNSRAVEANLDGEWLWASPPEHDIHHEASPMPNGNILALSSVSQDVKVPGGGVETWEGNRIVEFDRQTNEVLFDWSEFDNFSTMDFDSVVGGGDWTHSNAVVYNAADNSIYHSARHLSRITRIDYDTGNVVYMMGFDMPSGDVDFGDNLFSFQHAPQLLPNGNMMLFDNGNRRDHIVQTNETGVSKAIELQFTGDPPTFAEIVWEWTLPEYNSALGDADRLPGGNTLVTAGISGALYEVAPDTTVLWSLEVEGVFPQFLIYRADRVPSLVIVVPADITGDGLVNASDLAILLGAWGPNPGHPADITADGVVDNADLQALLAAWQDIVQ
jgi:hypothetical protein